MQHHSPYANQRVKTKLAKLFYALSDQIFTVGASFGINIIIARTETQAGYGTFVLVYSVFTFLAGIHNALISEAYTVFASGKYRHDFANYLQFILRINTAIVLGLALLVLTATGLLFLWWHEWFSSTLLGMAAGLPIIFTGFLFRRTFYVKHDSRSAASMSFIFFSTVSFLLSILYFHNQVNGTSAFLVLGAGWLFASPIFFRQYPITAGAKKFLSAHPAYWSEHWQYARWVLMTAFVFQLLSQGYLWLTGLLIGIEDVAHLRAVQNLILPINLIFSSISMLILPRMATAFQQDSTAGINPIVKKIIVIIMGIAVVFVLFIYLAGDIVLDFVYAGKYNASLPLLYIIALAPATVALSQIFNDALKAMKNPKLVFFAYLSAGVTTIVMGIPLILKFGIIGAAWGMILSGLIYGLVLFISYQKLIHKLGTTPPNRKLS